MTHRTAIRTYAGWYLAVTILFFFGSARILRPDDRVVRTRR